MKAIVFKVLGEHAVLARLGDGRTVYVPREACRFLLPCLGEELEIGLLKQTPRGLRAGRAEGPSEKTYRSLKERYEELQRELGSRAPYFPAMEGMSANWPTPETLRGYIAEMEEALKNVSSTAATPPPPNKNELPAECRKVISEFYSLARKLNRNFDGREDFLAIADELRVEAADAANKLGIIQSGFYYGDQVFAKTGFRNSIEAGEAFNNAVWLIQLALALARMSGAFRRGWGDPLTLANAIHQIVASREAAISESRRV